MKDTPTAGPHEVVTMRSSLTSAAGFVAREAGGSPVSYLHGSGNPFPKQEPEPENHGIGTSCLHGCCRMTPSGNAISIWCRKFRWMPSRDDNTGAGGQVVGAADDGTEVTLMVTELQDGAALDGNHPIAGQAHVFEVGIQGIRGATEDEIRTAKALD
jgi:hypothetical protein